MAPRSPHRLLMMPPGMCWDNQWSVDSIRKLRHLRDLGALVILGHELGQMVTVKVAPEAYE